MVNPPALPVTIAPGGTLDMTIKFIATTVPPHSNNQTNDTSPTNGVTRDPGGRRLERNTDHHQQRRRAGPRASIQLAGYWQDKSENENEPGLQTIINSLYGYGTNISSTQQPDVPQQRHAATLLRRRSRLGLWADADPTLPVTVRQLAAYHNQFD